MKNRLFLLCPASQLESFIRMKYGPDTFFLTALAAVFSLKQWDHVEELTGFIERESIEEVVVVNDVSCRFLQSVLTKQKGFGTQAEQVLIDLLVDNYAHVMCNSSVAEQKFRLAELNIQRQIEELLSVDYLLQQVVLQKLRVKGLITSRAEGKAMAVNMHARQRAL